jgi:hypothetical protein
MLKKKIPSTPSLPDDVLPPTYKFEFADDVENSEHQTMALKDYWESQASRPNVVKPLNKCCSDCAIKTNYYTQHARSLLDQPKDVQDAVLDRWYCHNNNNRGCAGVREFINQCTTQRKTSKDL